MKGMLNKKTLTLVSLLLFLTLLVGCFPLINQSPIITSTPITLAEVNELYTYEVEATDPDGDPLTYSLEVKPSGMTIISATGLIKWTPTAKGDYPVIVKVSDGTLDITQSFTIVVSEAEEPGLTPISDEEEPEDVPPGIVIVIVNQAPAITSLPGLTAIVGVEYTYTIKATDPEGDTITYSLEDGPIGMDFDAPATISWTPSLEQIGTHEVIVKASDGKKDATQSFTIVVTFFFPSVLPVHNITQGTDYNTIQTAIDEADPDDTIIVAAGTYDENLDINIQLTLQGAGKGTDPSTNTIITPSSGCGIYIHQPVNLKDLRVTGASSSGIRIEKSPDGPLNFSDVTWENVASSNNGGRGVETHNVTVVSAMTITNCEFVSNGDQGLRTASDVIVDGLVITDSKFNGNSYGIYLQGTINGVTILRSEFNDSTVEHGAYMTETGPLTNLVIEDSEFKNNSVYGLQIWNSQDNADITMTGTLFQNNGKSGVMIGGNTLTNVLIQDSDVLDNDVLGLGYYGIDFDTDADVMNNVAVHSTNITGHTVGGGIKNHNTVATAIVDATNNWWGDATGPNGEGLGAGDAVSANVDFDPWLLSEIPH